jgi:hypothetical protein
MKPFSLLIIFYPFYLGSVVGIEPTGLFFPLRTVISVGLLRVEDSSSTRQVSPRTGVERYPLLPSRP